MGFFDSIVDQVQSAAPGSKTAATNQSAAVVQASKSQAISDAESLIIIDETPANGHLETALGLDVSADAVVQDVVVLETTTPPSGLSLFDETPVAEISQSEALASDMIQSSSEEKAGTTGFGLFGDIESSLVSDSSIVSQVSDEVQVSEDLQVSSSDSIEMVTEIVSGATDSIAQDDSTGMVENPAPLLDGIGVFASEASSQEETSSVFSVVETKELVMDEEVVSAVDMTPESILEQAVASLRKISEANNAKRQAELDAESSLRQQIADEIEAHKARIASLEASANEAKENAQRIQEEGKKTIKQINMLEKELQAA